MVWLLRKKLLQNCGSFLPIMVGFVVFFFIPERMQHGHAALNWLLHRNRTGRGKMHGPKLRLGHLFVMMAFVICGEIRRDRDRKRNCNREEDFHGSTAGIRVYWLDAGES